MSIALRNVQISSLKLNTARNLGTHCIYSKCHKICSKSEQAQYKGLNGQGRWNISRFSTTYTTWLYNLTTSFATSVSYHQLVLYIRSVLANLQDSLSYIRTVSTHTMDYIDASTTGTLSPHILPVMDLNKMLSHIEETLPFTLHLPVSSEDTLHFYCYLCTHVLIANKQFLLLIDVPIQDWSQQLSTYKIFTLDVPHGNFTDCYDINTQYLGITQDETMAVGISPHQFGICQEANGQFCNISHIIPTTHEATILHYSFVSQEYG